MKFKVDENLPRNVATTLNSAGHDAESVHDEKMSGATDEHLADICRSEQRAKVTLDLGFADFRRYPPQDYAGIIVLRPARHGRRHILRLFARAAALLPSEPLAGRLWIVNEAGVRIRA